MVILEVQEDSRGDFFIQLDPDNLSQIGWDIGDVLIWEKAFSDSWIIRKKEIDSDEL